MRNNDLKEAAKSAGVRLWEVAEALRIRDNELSRRLRYDLRQDDRNLILKIIRELEMRKNV